MSNFYVKVTQYFAGTNDGYQDSSNILKFTVSNNGDYVVSSNALNEFPSIFGAIDASDIELIKLDREDFPLL